MEKKCKNLLSDKDLCTEHDGRVRKNGEISGEWSQGYRGIILNAIQSQL
jgi:hypothetical protein